MLAKPLFFQLTFCVARNALWSADGPSSRSHTPTHVSRGGVRSGHSLGLGEAGEFWRETRGTVRKGDAGSGGEAGLAARGTARVGETEGPSAKGSDAQGTPLQNGGDPSDAAYL